MMVDVRELTIPQARAGIKAGRFTAKELTAAFLERIDKLDKGGPNINSTLAISTTVLAEAEELDRYFEQNGKLKGRLHGIPILVKDQVKQSDTLLVPHSPSSLSLRPMSRAWYQHTDRQLQSITWLIKMLPSLRSSKRPAL